MLESATSLANNHTFMKGLTGDLYAVIQLGGLRLLLEWATTSVMTSVEAEHDF